MEENATKKADSEEVVDEVKAETREDPEETEANDMIGDKDNRFEDKNENKDCGMNGVVRASPPRSETAPVKHPASMRTSAGLCTSSCSLSTPAPRTVRRGAGCPIHS